MWRVLGLVLLMLAVGIAAGYVVADTTRREPVALDRPAPVPAESPAYPTPPAVEVLPDPDTPALEPDLPTKQVRLRTGKPGWALLVDEPRGWRRNRQPDGDWTWAVPGNPYFTYRLRVGILRGDNVSINVAKIGRLTALRDAEDDGNLSHFTVESETDDTFIATYVEDDHLRVTMERWVAFEGDTAYAVAAVTGRTVDRTGLMDLLERTTASMRQG